MMEYPKSIYASALLVDGKLKFWKISGNPKTEIHDWYKDFYYSGESMQEYMKMKNVESVVTTFIVNSDKENENAFKILAREWFKKFPLIENIKGEKPY